ncbi:MAG: exodeoxyribonuclease III, partial [Bacteroidota bacterium]
MRIVSYNVNGIRAALKKGLAQWAADTNIDVLCLQETKAEAPQVDMAELEAAGFIHAAWHSCRRKKGYSGVLTLSKVAPDYVQQEIGIEAYDEEGRIVRTDFGDLTVFNCYFPNGGQGEERQNFKYR